MVKSSPIPTIDFSQEGIKAGAGSWLSKCNTVREALEEFGCFVAVYDEVSPEMRNQAFVSLKELLDLPTDTKMKNVNSEMPYSGYLDLPDQLYESTGFVNATAPEAIQSFADLMWPSGNGKFCETVNPYAKTVSQLENVITRMLFESYGVEEYYDSHINSTTYLLRVNGYKPSIGAAQENGKCVGATAHTDANFFTILQQNNVQGLEVKASDDSWIPVHFPPSSLVVIAGDALLAWSNGRIHPCLHRVMIEGSEERYSVSMFSFHSGSMQIPQKLADDMHPLKFKPFDYFGYVHFRDQNLTLPAEERIKIYCGVSDVI